MSLKKKKQLVVFCSLFLLIATEHSSLASITEGTAVDIADTWYEMELFSPYSKVVGEERVERIRRKNERRVRYLVKGGRLLDNFPSGEEVQAYEVNYEPTGFVIVSGSENPELSPIISFNTEAGSPWRDPGNSPYFGIIADISDRLTANSKYEKEKKSIKPHPIRKVLNQNIYLKKKTRTSRNIIDRDGLVYFKGNFQTMTTGLKSWKWKTANWKQKGIYNDHVQIACGGQDIPTGCNPTAIAIKMRFHEWPERGIKNTSGYWDEVGGTDYYFQSNIAYHTYDWINMPIEATSVANGEIAELMHDCGVALGADYGTENTSADKLDTGHTLNEYFGYSSGNDIDGGSISRHLDVIKWSVIAGIPVILGPKGHGMIASGYRTDDHFWVNDGWGKSNSRFWTTLDLLPGKSGPAKYGVVDESVSESAPLNYLYVAQNPGSGELQTHIKYNDLADVIEAIRDYPNSDGNTYYIWIKEGWYVGYNKNIQIEEDVVIRGYYGTANLRNRLFINSNPNNDTLNTVPKITIGNGGKLTINE